jgi:hypothetical protein
MKKRKNAERRFNRRLRQGRAHGKGKMRLRNLQGILDRGGSRLGKFERGPPLAGGLRKKHLTADPGQSSVNRLSCSMRPSKSAVPPPERKQSMILRPRGSRSSEIKGFSSR